MSDTTPTPEELELVERFAEVMDVATALMSMQASAGDDLDAAREASETIGVVLETLADSRPEFLVQVVRSILVLSALRIVNSTNSDN